ncbi:Vegetative incompatibility protein HET-E-1, partial [Colletotrichum gloeosporioides]
MNINNSSSGKQYNNVGSGSQYNAENITITHDAEGDRQFLIDLKLSDPRLDKERIERTKGGLWKDSYIWIFDNEDFQRWRTDFQSRLLWIRGDPGKGKTMLLCGIVDELHGDKSAHQVIYFFCQATDSNLNTASAVLRGILYLALKKAPELVKGLREAHDSCDRQLFEGSNGWQALCNMTTSVLCNEIFQNVVVIIDALDECTTGVDELLQFVTQLSSKSIKIIVSSRNWPRIEHGIAAATYKAAHISLELNEGSISAAVVAFIEHKVSQLARKHDYSTITQSLVYNTLLQKSNSTFLWAALVCQQLADNSTNSWEVESKLNDTPAGLHELYDRMLDQALRSTNRDLSQRILAVASLVYRPVTVAELKSLLGLRDAGLVNDTQPLEKGVQQCGSFLTVRDGVMYFLHQSAKDFLLENENLEMIMPHGIGHEHGLLWRNSMEVMLSTLRYNICGLKTPGTSVDDPQTHISDSLEPMRYSCIHWIDHFCMMGGIKHSQAALAEKFFTRSFLHWAEASCLLRSVYESVGSLQRLYRFLQENSLVNLTPKLTRINRHDTAGFSRLTDLVQDASYFLQQGQQVIEDTPLQIYWSLLLFSPRQSIIRKLHLHEGHNFVLNKPLVKEKEWNTRLKATVYHEHCDKLRFSPDGSILVSESNREIKIWDRQTGRCLRTIRPTSHVSNYLAPLALSYDGSIAACGRFQCGTWDTKTGDCLQTLRYFSPSVSVECLALSQDGRYLATVTKDNSTTVDIWNAQNGLCLQRLDRNLEEVVAVVFSPDGLTLASASGCITIWEVEAGERLRDLRNHVEYQPNALCYTSTGHRIVSVSKELPSPIPGCHPIRKVYIWETSTGQLLQSVADVFNACNFTPLSPGGIVVCHRRKGHTFESVNLETGERLDTLVKYDQIFQNTVSSDGHYFATVSFGGTISLWDLTALRQGYRHSIDVWDAQSGRNLQTLHVRDTAKKQTRCCDKATAAFGREDTILLATEDCENVKIWDATTSSHLRSLPVGQRVGSMVFSDDATKIAIALHDRGMISMIQIWDPNTGRRMWELKLPQQESTSQDFLQSFSKTEPELRTCNGIIDLSFLTSETTTSLVELSHISFRSKPEGYHVEGNWLMKDLTRL